MFLRKFLFVYFHVTSVLLGIFKFAYDFKLNALKEKWILNLYSGIFSTVMLSTGPFYALCMYYNFTRQNYSQMLLIIWSLEYMTLFLMTCILYYTVNANQKSILLLINEGMANLRVPRQGSKSLRILFIKLFAIDHIAVIIHMTVTFIIGFSKLEERILGALCYLMNFISFFTTNAFAFILTLVRLEFEAINLNMASDILHDNHLSFLEDLRAHRRLRSFCHHVIRIFSKICIANMLYAFSTTISATISLYVMLDDLVGEFGYFYCFSYLIYILCTFSQIFTPIYCAKKLSFTYDSTKKILRVSSMNVRCEALERDVEEYTLEMLHNHMTVSFHNLFTLDYELWYATITVSLNYIIILVQFHLSK